MGADGHILIAKRSKWDQQFPDLDPQEFGFYTGESRCRGPVGLSRQANRIRESLAMAKQVR